MEWVFALIIIAVVTAVAFAASGRLGTMPEQIDDRPGPDLPAEGDLTAADLRAAQFEVVTRGYPPAQVDALLERLADQLDPNHVPSVRPEAPTADAITQAVDEPVAASISTAPQSKDDATEALDER